MSYSTDYAIFCNHPEIRFGSGDYYIFCTSCNRVWVSKGAASDAPDAEVANENQFCPGLDGGLRRAHD